MAELWVDEPVTCKNPDCTETQPSAQPDMDGMLLLYACACGYEWPAEFGQADGACAIGVPEDVRRAASFALPDPAGPVFLGTIGRRPA